MDAVLFLADTYFEKSRYTSHELMDHVRDMKWTEIEIVTGDVSYQEDCRFAVPTGSSSSRKLKLR